MSHRLVTTALAVLLAGGLAACGARDAGSVAPSAPGASGSPAIPSGPVQTLPSAKPPAKLTPPADEMTLTGQVQEGVESGCLVMKAGGQTYELIDGDPQVVHPGARVVVTGHLETGMMSHCMQGLMFKVTSARAA